MTVSPAERVVDLTADVAVTTRLLASPLAWRVRAVESLTIETADRCRRRRSLQCAPLREVLSAVVELGDATSAFLVLNVASVPRGPLYDFDVEGPDGAPAYLLPRSEIAFRERCYLQGLASEAGFRLPDLAVALVDAALAFSRSAWLVGDLADEDVQDYLSDGLATDVTAETAARWRALSLRCREVLEPSRSTDTDNVFDDLLLVLPAMRVEGRLAAPLECQQALEELASTLATAAALASEPSAALDFLQSLMDYGHDYDLLVATEVPLDRPFLLKYSEARQLTFDWARRTAVQDVVIADAVTNHVAMRVADGNVRLRDPVARTPDLAATEAFGDMTLSGRADTRAFYAHGDDREFRVRLHL